MRSVFLGIFLITAVSAAGQTPKPKVPRAPDSHPDLQGTWDFAQLTPFERPSALAGKSAFSDEEAEEFAQQRIETGNKDNRSGGAAAGEEPGDVRAVAEEDDRGGGDGVCGVGPRANA
jgi:hypothetical protein